MAHYDFFIYLSPLKSEQVNYISHCLVSVLGFLSVFILTLPSSHRRALSACTFILMEVEIQNGLDVWK